MIQRDPQWYKDAVIYELHVRAFYDSAADGAGEFRGLTQKLDYLQDLGITAVWLLPFYPSPLRDDGYDIADYTSIHRDYGTLEAFQEFLVEAHARGLRVITELVINHTSDQHQWFQRARRAPAGSPERDFYVWSDSPDKYNQTRIIFKDFETSNWAWDKVAKSYYWHRFYSHQPDLNFDNPEVWKAIFPVLDFWFDMGVDGLRLDAVPYLYEREGTNCENLPETHEFLRALRRYVDERFPDRMLLAEANQWPEDSVAYFGDGDECHMAFHFPVMPRLFMAMHMEDRLPVVDIMEQTPTIPESCQWAMFLRNHDELTLEMVTDEERDYMYQAYVRDPRARINLGIRHRLAPLLGNNRRSIELMNGLLFSLPGTPVLYYGDEIGMGDNIYLGDRNGVRTPMQWSGDRNAGFSRANPQQLYLPVIIDPEYHYEAVNVEAQQNNLNSLLWWTKRLIGLRRRYRAFGRGTLEFLRPLNRHILAFLRTYEQETILVVANLSRFVQCVELDLSPFEGVAPVELFGATPFPAVGKQPYLVMLGPHSFYWFSLSQESQSLGAEPRDSAALPTVALTAAWEKFAADPAVDQLEDALLPYIGTCDAPRGRQRLRGVRIEDILPIKGDAAKGDATTAYVLVLELEIAGGQVEHDWLPVALIDEQAAEQMPPAESRALIARATGGDEGWICDASSLPAFNRAVLSFIQGNRRVRGIGKAELAGVRGEADWSPPAEDGEHLPIRYAPGGGSRLTVICGEELVLTQFVQVEKTPRPDIQLGRWLSESRQFPHAPRWLGELEYRRRRDEPAILASLHAYVPNEGNAWQLTLDELSAFFDRTLTLPEHRRTPPDLDAATLKSPESALPPAVVETLGGYLETVRLLANLLAELHRVVSSETDDPHFSPEEFTGQYQRSIYQSTRNLTSRAMYDLRQATPALPEEYRDDARLVSAREEAIYTRFRRVVEERISAWRLRVHGDCHLARILRSGRDFVFTDMDGGPLSPGERRIKRSPLRDVAGMMHSFHFATNAALHGMSSRRGRSVGMIRPEDYETLTVWAGFWRRLVKHLFAETYRDSVAAHPYLAMEPVDFNRLIDAMLLERALVELRYQLAGAANAAGTAAALETILCSLDHPWNPPAAV